MARAEIFSGICGFTTVVEARANENDSYTVHLIVESECPAVAQLAAELGHEVNALQEFTYRAEPRILQLAPENLDHPACPVPAGIIKAIEVAAGLALPKDVTIKISKD